MKRRMHTKIKRSLAACALAQLCLVCASQAAAQAGVPDNATSVPVQAPVSQAPAAASTAPDTQVPPSPQATPVLVQPSAPVLVVPIQPGHLPEQTRRVPEQTGRVPEQTRPAPAVLPPALGVAITPAEPLEPASTAQSSGRLDQNARFSSSDGNSAAEQKPLFEVGDYRVRASGYVQAQYQIFKQSQNELSPDGLTLLNQSGFAVPRARALIEGSNDWSSLVLEYDVANVNSALSGVQRAEATLVWRNPESPVPYLAGTLGVFRTPFGFEAARSARDRLFAENATVTQAFFPGQSDTGARAEGGVAWFRYALAVVNGHPVNEPRWGGRTPTKQGDVLGRLGVDASFGRVRLVGGGSLLKGRGFSPGSPATKDSITVRDVNESGTVTQTSVMLQAGRAATASRTFDRWATGLDAELSAQVLAAWKLWLRGEFIFGNNLDRGLFISDPNLTGFNGRGYGAVGAIESLIFQTGLLGLRYDFYDPNPDAIGNVAGEVVKVPRRISTTSALVGLQLPGTRTRFFAEYDRVKDHLALGLNGRPADLKNDRFLCRLQVSLW